jgi:hypothetical protein
MPIRQFYVYLPVVPVNVESMGSNRTASQRVGLTSLRRSGIGAGVPGRDRPFRSLPVGRLYKDLENNTLKGSSSAHDTDREARSMACAIHVMRL